MLHRRAESFVERGPHGVLWPRGARVATPSAIQAVPTVLDRSGQLRGATVGVWARIAPSAVIVVVQQGVFRGNWCPRSRDYVLSCLRGVTYIVPGLLADKGYGQC
jgi:hypothetical protein